MMVTFLIIVSIFVNIGIVLHAFKYVPKFGLKFLMSFKAGKRKLKLTFNGRPVFKQEKLRPRRAADAVYIVALIPAWNEEESIATTIKSILSQTRIPDRIVVVPNNTTDQTADRAIEAGAEVMVMPGKNEKKKAGALNFALEALAPELDQYPESAVLVMDADTTIEETFIEKAERRLLKDRFIGGISSIFIGRNSINLLGILQQLEFARFKLMVKRRLEVFVLSGTASLISWTALKKVKEARLVGEKVPFGESYYDVESMTEDNELTLALLALGFTVPHVGVESVTDVMEDYVALFHQRKRWYLGALQNIQEYGRRMPVWMRMIYWAQQVGLYFSLMIAPIIIFAFSVYMSFVTAHTTSPAADFYPYSLALLIVYLCVQVITVWNQGWKARIVALLYVPEIIYALLLLVFYAAALKTFLLKKDVKWQHT